MGKEVRAVSEANDLAEVVNRANRFRAASDQLTRKGGDVGDYREGFADGRAWERKVADRELHEERNQAAICETALGSRVDDLKEALREALEGDRIDIDRLYGVLEAGIPKGRPVVHDAAK